MGRQVRFLSVRECEALKVKPYAVYGGRVHSLRDPAEERLVSHGEDRYRELVKKADALGTRGDK